MDKTSKNATNLIRALDLARLACTVEDISVVNVDYILKRARKAIKRFVKYG